ncbi:hypothetical protein [Janthinobacterium sp. Ant5-2-1]|uniref:hypothetical protein n=1 Tax=Janthinobacterium sp. Ant5-2-1 TaxID=1755239 RepID=UPI00071803C0|nr:hypothetical protein [Janthinobacterium sp. Ant5-2-1]
MSDLQIFDRQVRHRSSDHLRAMSLLAAHNLYGPMIAVLRQELDSMVRVIFLLAQPSHIRTQLIADSVNGKKWKVGRQIVTDRNMVDLAQQLQGWTASVYKFGCAFIHLSALHDYNVRDLLQLLPAAERDDILDHCRRYHGGPVLSNAGFMDLVRVKTLLVWSVRTRVRVALMNLSELTRKKFGQIKFGA